MFRKVQQIKNFKQLEIARDLWSLREVISVASLLDETWIAIHFNNVLALAHWIC